MDTVVVQVVDLPVVGVGRSVLNEVEHEVVTDDGRGEVVRVDTLVVASTVQVKSSNSWSTSALMAERS